ncbi:hypothetical protein [Geobacter sp. SVR]|uniref:hypothetical protein n=1 Tax=Geobacter sp. SVR TaxID=2495594 RepID=UPI00143F0180|nr:hypothetical protein [Geobacter sp. SVR]BCS54031.1 hypothetical protein GSVR_23390 [Geobacter sp. SVR]GCF86188.1 hypothetical protein GSbR_27880 [Geobacter sp. SVR]
MQQITPEKVKRDNSNIRKYSDTFWRELRKLNKLNRKTINPDPYTNEMMSEIMRLSMNPNSDFNIDVGNFVEKKLSEREAFIFKMFLYGGNIKQQDIANSWIGTQKDCDGNLKSVSQSLVNIELKRILKMFKEYYYDGEKRCAGNCNGNR